MRKESKIFKAFRYLCLSFVVVTGLVAIIGTGGGDGGGGGGGESNNDPVVSTSITSGSVVASAKPTSTNSPNSPTINLISYENVVSPGGSLTGRIDFNDANGDVKEIIIAEKNVNKHNVITADYSRGIYDGYIDFDINLSTNLDTGDEIEFDIGLRDDNGNVGNYHSLKLDLSNDTKYATTSYSGNSTPNISGDWYAEQTVNESNPDPDMYIGYTYNSSFTIVQSGSNLTLSDGEHSYNGTVSGNDQFVTITWTGTSDFLSQGYDIYADFSATLSGEIIDSNTIEGESNSIIRRVYGADAHLGQVYPISSDVVMTYSGSLSGGDTGGGDTGGGDDDDHGNDIGSATPISFGEDIAGEIGYRDSDYFQFHAVSGKTYTIETTLGSLENSFILLKNSSGSYLDGDIDSGVGLASKITWTCDNTASYYFVVGGQLLYEHFGTYTVSVSEEIVGTRIESWGGFFIDDDTSTGDKLYYFDSDPFKSRVEFSLAVPFYDENLPDAFNLGVNLPSSGAYPSDAASADISDISTEFAFGTVEYSSSTSPTYEDGRYYILVEKVNEGGPFRIRVYDW